MLLRGLAVLATVVVPALGLAVGGRLPGWALPSLAAALALGLLIPRPRALLSLIVVAGLAALSASTVDDASQLLRVTADPEAWPRYDLGQAPLPDDAEGFVVVEGHVRTEWTLDEYRVENGGRPDQNADAAAELVPVLGTEDDVVAPEGRIVIARVTKGPNRPTGHASARGELQPLPEGILDSLVTFDPELPHDQVSGVLLDTTRVPTRQQAWTQAAIALITSVLALVLALLAIGAPSPVANK